MAIRRAEPPLDPGRAVVYPVSATSAKDGAPAADEVTLALLASLNSTESISGIDGSRFPGGSKTLDVENERTVASIARRQRAGYYVTARLLASDSLHLLLDLHDVRAGTVIHKNLNFAPGTKDWAVGVSAALELLPVLILTGDSRIFPRCTAARPKRWPPISRESGRIARLPLERRWATFRRLFTGILHSHWRHCVEPLQRAGWIVRPRPWEWRRSLEREEMLPDRLAHLAHGFEDYMMGRADSALARFRHVIALDAENVEG